LCFVLGFFYGEFGFGMGFFWLESGASIPAHTIAEKCIGKATLQLK